MFREAPVYLSISPFGIDMLLPGQSEPRRIPLSEDGDAPGLDALETLRPRLSKAIATHKLKGRRTIAFYRSSSLFCQLTTVKAPSKRSASDASRLSCLNGTPYTPDDAVIDSCFIGRDRKTSTPGYHFVTAVEGRRESGALVDLVESCGLSVETLIPEDAVFLADEARRTFQYRSDKMIARLFIGQHRSWLFAQENGRLEMFRTIGLGLKHLVGAMTRPILINEHVEPVQIDPQQAAWILRYVGIPDRETIINEEHGVTGLHVLPLLQPILQRLLVELKQSLRFGLSSAQRSSLSLIFSGPGAMTPHLAALISESLEIPAQIEADPTAVADLRGSAMPGVVDLGAVSQDMEQMQHDGCQRTTGQVPLADAARIGAGALSSQLPSMIDRYGSVGALNLLPPAKVEAEVMTRVNKGVRVGIAVAAAAIAFDTLRLEHIISQRESGLEGVGQIHQRMNIARERQRELQLARATMNQLEWRVAATSDLELPWPLALHDIAEATPQGVLLTLVDGQAALPTKASAADAPSLEDGIIRIRGHAVGQDSHAAVRQFVEKLNACPLFTSVSLGAVQQGLVESESAQHFNVTIRCMLVPSAERSFASLWSEEPSP